MESREFQRNQLQFSYFSPNYLKFEEDFYEYYTANLFNR